MSKYNKFDKYYRELDADIKQARLRIFITSNYSMVKALYIRHGEQNYIDEVINQFILCEFMIRDIITQ